MKEYDYIIIGSGFGGSVSALRLSQKGYNVLVIEKGKWYQAKDFPKSNWNLKKWLWAPKLRWHGIMKMSFFRHISIISGVGVGGGSLVYANTLPIPKKTFFNSGSWNNLADWETELKPHYRTALEMLGATKNPLLFDGDKALKTLAKEIDREHEFDTPNVAVYFGEPKVKAADPYFKGKGPERVGCHFCGGCMTGCRHNSKNTLDKNYLYLAQNLGAEILAEHEVFNVIENKNKDGYIVSAKKSTSILKKKVYFKTKGVIFSGGVMGTIKLLLKLKKQSLPLISNQLGEDIRTNNESLISVTNLDGTKNLSKGVAIGSILHTDEDSHLEICRYSSGSGFWKTTHLPYVSGKIPFVNIFKMVISFLKRPLSFFKMYFVKDWAKSTATLLFMQTLDSKLTFKKNKIGVFSSRLSEGKKPRTFIPRAEELAKKYAKIINGNASVFALEPLAGIPSTAHILGGAVMGKDVNEGVIDKNNLVFGYKNLLIIDGSMISANPGVNPSLSITAIAENAMSKIKNK
ncbi:MAG: FAD-dependent oxidoreductase [Flavobacteriales bacterium]|nr:FAD-dependent oxidoreductase [Flavobacteriales bacterium]